MRCVLNNGGGNLTYKNNHLLNNPDAWPLWNVRYCGICKSDRHFIYQDETKGKILGHEVVCQDDTGGYFCLNNEISCGHCEYCLDGKESHCINLQELGVNRNGGYAEKISAPSESMFSLPFKNKMTGVFVEPLACAFHALDRLDNITDLRTGKSILILGSGVSGKILLQLLLTGYGNENNAISLYDINIESMNWAKGSDKIECISDLSGRKFDVVIECSGSPAGMENGISALRNGGVFMIYGIQPAGFPVPLSAEEIFSRELTIVASKAGCNRDTFTRAMEHINSHQKFYTLMLGKIISLRELPDELKNGEPLHGTRTIVEIDHDV